MSRLPAGPPQVPGLLVWTEVPPLHCPFRHFPHFLLCAVVPPPPAPPHLSPAALPHRCLWASAASLIQPALAPHRGQRGSILPGLLQHRPGEPSGQHLSDFPKAPATSCPLLPLPLPPAPRLLWLLLTSQGNILSQGPACPWPPRSHSCSLSLNPRSPHSAWQPRAPLSGTCRRQPWRRMAEKCLWSWPC